MDLFIYLFAFYIFHVNYYLYAWYVLKEGGEKNCDE